MKNAPDYSKFHLLLNLPPEIKNLISRRNKLRRTWQLTRDPSFKTQRNRLASKIKRKIKILRKDSWKNYIESLSPTDDRELYYLNAERKLNNSLMWKKNHNVPLQECLQNIHQNEMKNEEAYQSIMEQMDKLNQHTDLLCLKVEKLEIFRDTQVGHDLKNYPLTLRYMPQNVNTVQSKKVPIVSHFESYDLNSPALKTAATQTESNVYCDNCKSLIQVSCQSRESFKGSSSSFIDVLSVSRDEPQVLDLLKSQNASFTSSQNYNDDNSQLITSALNASQIYQNKNNNEKDSKNELVTNEKYEVKFSDDSTTLKEKQLSLQSNDILVAENALKSSGNNEMLIKSQSKANDSETNVGVSVHKSDVDSVNHEFDFLESETAHSFSKINNQSVSKTNTTSSSNINKSTDQVTSSEMRSPNKSSMMLGKERDIFQSNKEQEISDNKSEISGSVSGSHSPAISLSDSNSINEKGSFTASTAYQSLLGNTVMASKINKEMSESESEDEVEKTLARTVQNSNIKSKSIQSKKSKNASQYINSEPAVNKPKPVSANKPQSKLSKGTKKVLGIDTSSSSDIETAVKPPVRKKDEDSDEFDFYD